MTAREWVRPVILECAGVTLRPLAEDDLEGLHTVTPMETFRWYSVPPSMTGAAAFIEHMRGLIADAGRLHMAVVVDGRVVGSTAFYDIRPEHRALEVGFTWYAPAWRGTRVNPACKLMMFGHAIESLGAVRVQIKTDRRNVVSQGAIEKMGATYEGVLRRNFIQPDGYVRDTVMYSVLAEEWARVRAGLLSRLSSAGCSQVTGRPEWMTRG